MKKFLCLLLCFLMLIGVTACGADENAKSSSLDLPLEEVSSQEEATEETSKTETSSLTEGLTASKGASSGKVNNSSSRNQTTTSVKISSGKRYPTDQRQTIVRRANIGYFKVLGRGAGIAPYTGISLNWSCASVEFDVDCEKELAVEFIRGNGASPVYVEIYVDGKLIEERTRIDTSGIITICENLKAGVHRVKIVRQSDAECPTLLLTKIHAYGSLVQKAPENKPLYIEAIGDANLIGWGVRLEDSFYTDFSENAAEKQPIARYKGNEDGTLAYTYVAAEKLNADTYTLAKQGVGIAATYHKKDGKVGNETVKICNARNGLLPTMYDYCLPIGNEKYKPNRLPDVIVIDAGAADIAKSCQQSVLNGDVLGIDTVEAGIISLRFLNDLRVKNPKAKIIWCYGFTNSSQNLEKYVTDAIAQAGGSDKGFYSLKLTTSTRSAYPSAKEHSQAAELLANKIKQIIK